VQVAGAVGLLTVAIAHLCEGLRLFPEMEWGKPRSAGHYVDLAAAILGLTLFPLGYLRSRRS
jgi:succinate dehydrogenase/fumarate reductase cytochrome b subunit